MKPNQSSGCRPVVRLLVTFSIVLATSIAVDGDVIRVKRQLPPIEIGNQVVDDIFQIPISTLNAVGSLIKSARPLVRRTRERIQQYYNNGQQQTASSSQSQQLQQQQQYTYGNRPNPVQYNSQSTYGNRPYYSYFNGGSSNYNNRKKQQRDDPLPQGRNHRHGGIDDY